MDYIIVGAGPSGLALAWYLSQENKTVLLIDKEKSIGGCHRVQYVDGLFTEHGPRVYSDSYLNFIEILNEMNLDFNTIFTPYNVDISKIGDKDKKDLSFREKLHFGLAMIKLTINPIYGQNTSVLQFMQNNNFSDESIDYIERVCRLTDGAEASRYTVFQFLQLMNNQGLYNLYQPTLPNDEGLLKYWENKLKETKMVTFLLNNEVVSLNPTSNKINSITVRDRLSNQTRTLQAKNYILAIPPKPLNTLTPNMAFGDLSKWSADNSYFEYLPVTLHWTKKLDLPVIWGFPASDWGLAFIILSNYMTFSNEYKTVISSCITFTDRKSRYTNKTANESSLNEIYVEVIRQLRLAYAELPNPDRIIMSPQVYKSSGDSSDKSSGDPGKWINIDTAYVVTTENEFLPFTSQQYNNLYNCGCHNGKSNYHFTSMEAAISNSLALFNTLEPNAANKRYMKEYKQISNYIRIGLVLIIIIFSIIWYGYKYYKLKNKI